MPLSEEQTMRLKNPETTVGFKQDNPKKPGTKSWERYDKYKSAGSVGQATSLGASWSDLSTDFEKGYLTFKDENTPGAAKRGAPDGTPDREAHNRAKHKPKEPSPKPLMLGMASDVVGSAGSAPLEMSAATVATFRAIMREELSEFEQSISSRFDASFTRLQDELHRETTARKELEQRVARLEATPQPSTQSEDVDKTVAVIGGFGEKDANQTESFLKEILAETDGLVDVYATSPDPVVAFAQFTTQEKVLKFVRAQKTHVGMRQHKLWAAENKPASERKRGKILSKIKKFAIELDSIEPRNIVVNYRRCKVSVRHGGQLVHAAFVAEDGAVEWAVRNCPVSEQVRDAIMDFAEDLE